MRYKNLTIAIVIAALIVAAGLYVVLSCDSLDSCLFDVTGEENTGSQINALPKLARNITYRPLRTEPDIPIDNTGVNPFGINTFLHQEVEVAKREEQLRLISEAGFHWIRQEFPWEDIEIHGRGDFIDRRNNPDGIDAWEKYDNIVELSEKYGVEIIARLSNPPAWSREAGNDIGTYAPPDDFTDYANYAAAVAERYRGKVHYYQVWNEPNIYPEWGEQVVSPEAYTELLCEAYDAIKAVDPDAVVLSGALAPTNEVSGRDFSDFLFLQRMYDAGAGDCFDILAMQGYGLWSGPTDYRMRPIVVNYGRNQFIRDIMVKNGDEHKAIWISEMNWNVAPEDVEARYGRVTLEQQAEWAPLAYQRAQEDWPWVGVINFWYFKRASDDWLSQRFPEAYFQMAEPDFTLMPVYESMKEYANQPPVMYTGYHSADHWAVDYGDEAISFTFQGTSLEVVLADAGSKLIYEVDDGGLITLTPSRTHMRLWKGMSGRHTVEIRQPTEITYFIVKDAPFPAAIFAAGLVIVLAAASIVLLQRHKRGEDGG